MECNRDEAIRARDIAEQKFAMLDFAGAKKFIIKAQQLYPPLDGAVQMLAVLDVHIAAQVKLGINETDWYGILQVEPLSDDSTIKKQYRKLALMLHPDKNKSMGAEAAFKLIGEAFGVLSDKAKRFLHDSKRGGESRISQMASQATEPPKPTYSAYQAQYQATAQTTTAAGAQAPQASNTFWTACPLCRMQYQYMRTYLGYQLLCQKCHKPFLANDINVHPANGANAFAWPRGSFGNNGSFQAGPVPLIPKKNAFNFQTWVRNGGVAPGNVTGNGFTHFPGGTPTAGVGNNAPGGTAGVGASAATTASLVHEAYRKAQRDRVDAERELKRKEKEKEKLLRQQEREAIKKARENAKTHEAMERLTKRREEAIRKAAMKAGTKKRLRKRKRDSEDEDVDEDEADMEQSSPAHGSRADFARKSSRHRRYVAYELGGSDNEFEATPVAKTHNDSRMEKGKSLLCDDDGCDENEDENEDIWGDGGSLGRKPGFVGDRSKDPLQEQLAERFRRELAAKLGIPTRDSTRVSPAKMDDGWGRKAVNTSDASSVQHLGNSSVCHGKINGASGHVKEAATGTNCSSPASGEEAIVVPDPDFHDFDADRTERHVRKNQVWAVFDETDGMPRFYCQVNKVSRDPFAVEAVWLEPVHPCKDSFQWLNERDLSISCGEFKLGDEVEIDSINMFSHPMTIKRYKNGYEVYPKRAEVWAIYRDYDNELTISNAVGRVQFRYDFVLVRSDFSAITGGGRVVRLEKLAGFKTLWVPNGDAYPLTVKYDLHKFSHRVPALLVTEENIKGVPAECLELDPASTPANAIEI